MVDHRAFAWETVLVDGNWIHYRVGGPPDGPPMVHQHGFAISGTYLLPTAERLTDRFRVYIPDLPGFGRSPKPARPMGIEELGATLDHFMDAVGIERAVLVGNSLGCAIISELIALSPEKVSRAVLVSLAGGPHNQPLVRAIGQMALDGLGEPPGMITVAAPDYLRFGPVRALRLFTLMTRFPAVDRFLAMLSGYASYRLDEGQMWRFVLWMEAAARVPLLRESDWFRRGLDHLEGFATEAGTYRFPRDYLRERANGYYLYAGAHMGLGENRRRRAAIEIESTFHMLLIRQTMCGGEQQAGL